MSHFALSLRYWVARLELNLAHALQYVNEATYRVWRLYMAACALEFEAGDIGIFQVLAGERPARNLPLPPPPGPPDETPSGAAAASRCRTRRAGRAGIMWRGRRP